MFLSEPTSLIKASTAFLLMNKFSFLIMIAFALSSCSSVNSMIGGNTKKEAITSAQYLPDPAGITIDVKSVSTLNYVNDEPHTLAVAVIQVDSPKAAIKLAQNPESLDKLLIGSGTSDASVTAYDRFVVQPSSSDEIVLARAQDTQIIIVYAAYFNSLLENRVRLQEIPLKISSTGLVAQTYQADAAPLNIQLQLGDTAIKQMTVPKDQKGEGELLFKNSNNPTLKSAIPILKSVAQGVMGL